jgi:hypothetical protein
MEVGPLPPDQVFGRRYQAGIPDNAHFSGTGQRREPMNKLIKIAPYGAVLCSVLMLGLVIVGASLIFSLPLAIGTVVSAAGLCTAAPAAV